MRHGGAGVTGTPFDLDDDTQIWPLLLSAAGDAPFAAKQMCACGHTAFGACPRCCLLGTRTAATADGADEGAGLTATAFGGAAHQAHVHRFDDEGKWGAPNEDFIYAIGNGSFNKEAAASIAITDDMALQLGDLAERITTEERATFDAAVAQIHEGAASAEAQAKGALVELLHAPL